MARSYSRRMTEARPTINAASPSPRPRGGVADAVPRTERLPATATTAPETPSGTSPASFPPAATGPAAEDSLVDTPAGPGADTAGAEPDRADRDDPGEGVFADQSVLDGPVVWSPIVWSPLVQSVAAEADAVDAEATTGAADPAPTTADLGAATADLGATTADLGATTVDLSAGAPRPAAATADGARTTGPSEPVTAGTPTAGGQARRTARRLRFAVLAGVAAALVGVGVAWAALDGPVAPRGGGTATRPPTVQPGALPPFTTGALPGADPIHGTSVSPSVSPSTSASPSVSVPASGPVTTEPTRGGNGGGTAPGGWPPYPGGQDPEPGPSESWHTWPTYPPEVTEPPATQAPATPLTATLTRSADGVPADLAGYEGTVRINNPGASAVHGWRVTIALPDDDHVGEVRGAAVHQDGSTVVFTPKGRSGTVPAWGSVSFTFRVFGVLPGEPTGCDIDGRPCG
jgi:Cellulose binding domain